MKIAAEPLKAASVSLLESLGADPDEAKLVADVLVMADMRGISTHGVHFLPMIAERVKADVLRVPTQLDILVDDKAVTHIDGGNGLGQVAAEFGMRQAIAKAREFGISCSLIRNTNHIGLLAFYSSMAASEGMLGFCMSNSAAALAPWGGAEAFFGTNPFSVAVPSGEADPILLDMSTSVAARGKIRRALREGEQIPLGWALDETGIPTEDPAKAMKGSLMPVGGPKGYGMAMFIDLICGLLSGSKYSRDLLTFHKPLGPTGVGVTTVAVDITRFMSLDNFFSLAEPYIQTIRESRKAAGNSRIYLPGEIEAGKERTSKENGIEISPSTVEAINGVLEQQGLAIRIGQG